MRRRWLLTSQAGQALVELVEDQVSAHMKTRVVSWREVKVELIEHGHVDGNGFTYGLMHADESARAQQRDLPRRESASATKEHQVAQH